MGSQYPPAAHRWRCDLSDNSLSWTAGVFDLFGLPRFMAIDRRDIVAMYTPESRAMLERLRSDAIENCGSFTFEARIEGFDGQKRWIRITADVIVENGRARHLYGLKQDISAEIEELGRMSACA